MFFLFPSQIDPKLMFNRANTEDNLFSNSAKTIGIERLVMPRKISYTMNDERRKRSLKLAKHILTIQNYLNERLIPSTTERPVSLNLQPLSEQLALGSSSSSSSSAVSSSDPNLASLPHHVPLTREKSLPKNLPTKSENTEECFLSFTDVLGGLFSRMYFARFLDSEFSAENLDFWLAVQAFKIFSPDEIQEDCFAHVLEIVAAYVVPGAPFQVNLSNNVRVALLERIEKMKQSGDRPSVNIFDDAQRWVFDLMKNDPYRRFLESELYADLLEYLAENGANVHIEMLREFVSDVSVSPDSSTRSSFSGPSNTGGFTTTITPPTPTITTSNNNNFSNHNNNNNSNHHHHNNTTNSNHNSNHNNNHNSNNYNNNNNNGYSSNNSSFNYDDRPEKSQSFDSSSASSSSSSNYQLAPWSLSECFDGTYVFKRVNSKPVRCRRYLRVIEAPADKLWNTLLDMSEKRSRWLQEFVSASVVEIIDHNVQILHVIQTPPFKARKGRDFCILRVVLQDEKISGDKYILYRSITHKACPESKDFSRCKMWTSGFMITPAPSRTNNWNVVFLTQVRVTLYLYIYIDI